MKINLSKHVFLFADGTFGTTLGSSGRSKSDCCVDVWLDEYQSTSRLSPDYPFRRPSSTDPIPRLSLLNRDFLRRAASELAKPGVVVHNQTPHLRPDNLEVGLLSPSRIRQDYHSSKGDLCKFRLSSEMLRTKRTTSDNIINEKTAKSFEQKGLSAEHKGLSAERKCRIFEQPGRSSDNMGQSSDPMGQRKLYQSKKLHKQHRYGLNSFQLAIVNQWIHILYKITTKYGIFRLKYTENFVKQLQWPLTLFLSYIHVLKLVFLKIQFDRKAFIRNISLTLHNLALIPNDFIKTYKFKHL